MCRDIWAGRHLRRSQVVPCPEQGRLRGQPRCFRVFSRLTWKISEACRASVQPLAAADCILKRDSKGFRKDSKYIKHVEIIDKAGVVNKTYFYTFLYEHLRS